MIKKDVFIISSTFYTINTEIKDNQFCVNSIILAGTQHGI